MRYPVDFESRIDAILRQQGVRPSARPAKVAAISREIKRGLPTARLAGDLYTMGSLGAAAAVNAGVKGAGGALLAAAPSAVSAIAAGATVGSVFPVVGTIVGAIIGAAMVLANPAPRYESQFFDDYKTKAGSAPGHTYNPQYLNEAFVGLFRLKKNTTPYVKKYGNKGDAKFLDDMAAKIADAVKAGTIGAGDDANSVYSKVVRPWIISTMGSFDGQKGDWAKWEEQIVRDKIDQYLYAIPSVAASYTTARMAEPQLSKVLASMQKPSDAAVTAAQNAASSAVSSGALPISPGPTTPAQATTAIVANQISQAVGSPITPAVVNAATSVTGTPVASGATAPMAVENPATTLAAAQIAAQYPVSTIMAPNPQYIQQPSYAPSDYSAPVVAAATEPTTPVATASIGAGFDFMKMWPLLAAGGVLYMLSQKGKAKG